MSYCSEKLNLLINNMMILKIEVKNIGWKFKWKSKEKLESQCKPLFIIDMLKMYKNHNLIKNVFEKTIYQITYARKTTFQI